MLISDKTAGLIYFFIFIFSLIFLKLYLYIYFLIFFLILIFFFWVKRSVSNIVFIQLEKNNGYKSASESSKMPEKQILGP